MAGTRTDYVCQECGARAPKWLGRCPACGAWNSYVESIAPKRDSQTRRRRSVATDGGSQPARVRDIAANGPDRLQVPIAEFSRVLGGGIVPGSVVLVGGDPGVGKSTLLMQVSNAVAKFGSPVLYVSGEESLSQLGMRARRLGLDGSDLLLLAETDVSNVLARVEQLGPRLVVVDSVQSVFDTELDAPAGSVPQLRQCASRLIRLAKELSIPIFLIGHVTKEGVIAGPKLLEHMVDAVLYLEGERFQAYRMLRGTKNRFGPTDEVGVFDMRGDGLVELADPSAAFLAERARQSPGSAVVVTMEGTRPLVVEIQALVSRSGLAVPRRVGRGIAFERLLLLVAVLARRLGLPLHDQDVYVNVVGGLRIEEPAADLAIALAILSSLKDRPIDPDLVCVGEVGLSAEVRSVGRLEPRLKEAAKLGFKRALIPRTSGEQLNEVQLALHQVTSLREAAAAGLAPVRGHSPESSLTSEGSLE